MSQNKKIIYGDRPELEPVPDPNSITWDSEEITWDSIEETLDEL